MSSHSFKTSLIIGRGTINIKTGSHFVGQKRNKIDCVSSIQSRPGAREQGIVSKT